MTALGAGTYWFAFATARDVCSVQGEPFADRFGDLPDAPVDRVLFDRLVAGESVDPIWVTAREHNPYQPSQGLWTVIGGNTAIIATMRAMVDTLVPGTPAPYRIAWGGTLPYLTWFRASGYDPDGTVAYLGHEAERTVHRRLKVAGEFSIPFLVKGRGIR